MRVSGDGEKGDGKKRGRKGEGRDKDARKAGKGGDGAGSSALLDYRVRVAVAPMVYRT